ncbi:hypothetical protein EWM62_04680 [Mucilaginibacter terrigena]|uniref:Uncharacterized protein n=1 Tax=Mucilaginibacter terrigena TaxID=2492395 RepID=A0A4V1ZC31_9SPHI|nr:hypothetical protein [Mucilaginibacter terrigena]RYU91240.1 hypothetical protein EWM62_04680 [Mucilaginibacter terrigena]
MKRILLILIAALSTSCLYAQKSGFDEIQINGKFSEIKLLTKYNISKDTCKYCWIVKSDSMKIFLTDIDRLEIKVNKNDTIKVITAFSKPMRFRYYKSWSNKLTDLFNYINVDLRKKGSGYYSHVPQYKVMQVWIIKEEKTAMFFETIKPDFLFKDFVGTYVFWWIEDKNGVADITY